MVSEITRTAALARRIGAYTLTENEPARLVATTFDLHRGNGIPWPRDKPPKIAVRPETVSAETETQPQEPANCGLLGRLREISRFERVRGGAERTRTISQDIMPDRASGVYAPAAVASSSFTHRIDRPSENTTCQTRLRHDVVFLRRREGRVTEQVFDTFHIAGILTRPEAGRCMTESV
jgi:hypothetical protein